MKKLIYISILVLISFACQNEVKTNTPAFQAEKDNVFWKATSSKVTSIPGNQNGFVLSAFTANEVLTITVPTGAPGTTYDIDATSPLKVSYTFTNGNEVRHYVAENMKGSGQITLNEDISGGKYSGTFFFNLVDENGKILNFNKGNFYKVQKQ